MSGLRAVKRHVETEARARRHCPEPGLLCPLTIHFIDTIWYIWMLERFEPEAFAPLNCRQSFDYSRV
jgi:hypothetical protein